MSEQRILQVLVREASALAADLAESNGEITPELEAQIDHSNQSLHDKADRYGFVRQALKAQLQMANTAISEWDRLRTSTEAAIENLDARMLFGLQALDLTEISGDNSIFKLQANPPSVFVEDLTKIPGEFLVTKIPEPVTSVDKIGIKNAILSGKSVPGVRLERGVRLIHKSGTKRLK